MPEMIATAPPLTTVAGLLQQLGGISAERIRLKPPPGTATEQDVITIHDREKRLYELVDETLVEKASGFYQSCLATTIGHRLLNFLDRQNLGIVTGAAGAMRLKPGLVRMPDVSFVAWERFPDGRIPSEPIPDLAPDLAVEVLSAKNTAAEMQRKRREYFDAGTRLVWILDPKARTMDVYRSDEEFVTIRENEIIDGGEVLPGFSLLLKDVFDSAERQSSRGA